MVSPTGENVDLSKSPPMSSAWTPRKGFLKSNINIFPRAVGSEPWPRTEIMILVLLIVYCIAQLFYYIAQLCNIASPPVPASNGGSGCRSCWNNIMKLITYRCTQLQQCRYFEKQKNIDILLILIMSHFLDNYLDYVGCLFLNDKCFCFHYHQTWCLISLVVVLNMIDSSIEHLKLVV